ncbi:conserved Plasmodium protein, unknown function [Plasmodium malariae]|uniref:Uncharacterized protein n=1 Tax=Plasmodium malariae TaxID=5858 RepID=A0A1C3KDE7_PLAMA|nr:conserved Plasmodium protein, unknown function [Plasmodium malariae]
MLNIKREILENDNSKLKNKENNHSVWNKITQNKINKEIHVSSNKTVQRVYFNKNIKNVSSESNQKVISENSSEDNEAIIKEYESTEDENVKLSLTCHSNVDISTWNYGKIKSNIHSNFRDISNIMDKIQSNKKKLEDTKNNIELKKKENKNRFTNDEDGEHIMKKRLEALCDIEKKHLQLLQDLFEEYKDMEERML